MLGWLRELRQRARLWPLREPIDLAVRQATEVRLLRAERERADRLDDECERLRDLREFEGRISDHRDAVAAKSFAQKDQIGKERDVLVKALNEFVGAYGCWITDDHDNGEGVERAWNHARAVLASVEDAERDAA